MSRDIRAMPGMEIALGVAAKVAAEPSFAGLTLRIEVPESWVSELVLAGMWLDEVDGFQLHWSNRLGNRPQVVIGFWSEV